MPRSVCIASNPCPNLLLGLPAVGVYGTTQKFSNNAGVDDKHRVKLAQKNRIGPLNPKKQKRNIGPNSALPLLLRGCPFKCKYSAASWTSFGCKAWQGTSWIFLSLPLLTVSKPFSVVNLRLTPRELGSSTCSCVRLFIFGKMPGCVESSRILSASWGASCSLSTGACSCGQWAHRRVLGRLERR